MRVIIQQDENSVAKDAYEFLKAKLSVEQINTIGLPTGNTPLKLYREIAEGMKRGELDFSGVHAFMLAEYLGLADNHPGSCRQFMEENLFQYINLNPDHIHCLNGLPDDLDNEGTLYEQEIEYLGGIKLLLLGLGRNGHIGFNEPTVSLESRSTFVPLTQQTIRDKAPAFGSPANVPKWAMTMGIGTINDADEILLIATGAAKADAVAAMIEGPLTAACPASALQLHPAVTVIVDSAAAAKLKNQDYYMRASDLEFEIDEYLEKARRRAGIKHS